jgi:hypothetical protein
LQFLNSDEAWIESTSWGCPCEGLGVSAKISGDSTGFSAWANKNFGTVGFDSVPIDADAISATTSAIVNSVLKVTHFDYHPMSDASINFVFSTGTGLYLR